MTGGETRKKNTLSKMKNLFKWLSKCFPGLCVVCVRANVIIYQSKLILFS